MTTYAAFPAIFTKEEDGKWSVDFPDFEGCYTCGDNLKDAQKMAIDVLEMTLKAYKTHGKEIPEPKSYKIMLAENQRWYYVHGKLPEDDYISDGDNVNHPSHYEKQCSLECIDVMEACFDYDAVFDFCVCNAFKYLWRHRFKNGEEDMMKAAWYIDKAEQIMYDVGDEEHLMGKLIKVKELYKKVTKKGENIDSE